MTAVDTRVLANQKVSVFIGPDTAIANYNQPLLSELATLINVSEAIRWNSFNFNLKASTQASDRSLTDAADAQTRSYNQFGGAIEFYSPKPVDTSSILRTTRNLVKTPRTMLAVVVRVITLNSVGIAVGDELNAYHVMTDQNTNNRQDTSYSYSITFVPQNDCAVNYIVPAAVPTAVTLTPSGALTGTVGQIGYLTAAYQGLNVTIGATYTSSDPTVATVSPQGILQYIKAGTTQIAATYPGSAAGAAQTLTVS